MKRKRRHFLAAYSVVLLLAAAYLLPAPGFAYTLEVKNPYDTPLAVALVDFDDIVGKWRCHGWYEIEPRGTGRISKPDSTQRNHLYLFAQNAQQVWPGEGGADGSITRTVISNAFRYYDGEECPEGENRRNVFLRRYALKAGFLSWFPE